MIRCLAIGDAHIPRRAKSIPDGILNKLNELSEQKSFDYTFFTGDLITAFEFIDFLKLKTINNVFIVIGNMDYYGGNRSSPIYQNLGIKFLDNENLSIGLTHGHQIEPRGDHSQLEYFALNEKGCNILISGHTHKEEIFLTNKGILLLNPGSVTGAWSFIASGIPSFINININEDNKYIEVILFQLDNRSKEINELKSYFIFKNNSIHYRF
ncbi:MAG: YfcE family phosphodiesterase [Promethearchaeota archaeon]